MKIQRRSTAVALASLLTAPFVASMPSAFALGVLIAAPDASERCWIDQIHYTRGYYNAAGHCEELNARGGAYPVAVPFSAAGRYDETTREASETMRIVKGGLDVPSHVYYGTIASHFSCARDPWLNPDIDCGVTDVSATDTIPGYFVDSLVRQRHRPFTSDQTSAQRATVNQEYQAAVDRLHRMVQEHPGTRVTRNPTPPDATPARTMSVTQSGRAPSHAAKEIGALSALRAGGTTIRAPEDGTSPTNRVNLRIDIVEPTPGSTLTQGNVRIRIAPPTGYEAGQQAEVELSWLPPRRNDRSATPPSPPAAKSTTWQLPLEQLVKRVLIPRDRTTGWVGPTLVRVRTIGARPGPWSEGVSFNLMAVGGSQAVLPSPMRAPAAGVRVTGDWSAAQGASVEHRSPAAPARALGATNAFGSAGNAAAAPPPSALQPRP